MPVRTVGWVLRRASKALRAGWMVFCVWGVAIGAQGGWAADDAGLTLDELIARVKHAEAGLFNGKMDVVGYQSKRSASDAPWTDTGVRSESTVWYSGVLGGKLRVDVHREFLEWTNGAAALAGESLSLGYDGRQGRIARHAVIIGNETSVEAEGVIQEGRPAELANGFRYLACGLRFILNYQAAGRDRSASGFLEGLKQYKIPVEVSTATFEQTECVKVSIYGGEHILWFDPERGYAYRGSETYRIGPDGSRTLYEREVVSQLVEVPGGVWLPTRATRMEMPLQQGGSQTLWTISISGIVANDPEFDEAVYVVPFPPGYRVTDETRGGTTYTTGAVDTIDRGLDVALREVASTEAATVQEAGDDNDLAAAAQDPCVAPSSESNEVWDDTGTHDEGPGGWVVLVGLVVVCLAVGGLWTVAARRR